MSSPTLSANAVILLHIIRGVRRPAIPANNQLAPAGCPLHRLSTNAQRTGIAGPEYERAVRELITRNIVVLSGWCTRFGHLRFGRRLTIVFPELIPEWFSFQSDSYVIGTDGKRFDSSDKRAALAQSTSSFERRAIEARFEYTLVHELKLHVVADGLTQGVESALTNGMGPDGLTHELRRITQERKKLT